MDFEKIGLRRTKGDFPFRFLAPEQTRKHRSQSTSGEHAQGKICESQNRRSVRAQAFLRQFSPPPSLPPAMSNPYTAFQLQAKSFLFVEGGATFLGFISFFQILMGISLLMTSVSIGSRIYRGEKLWLVRMSNSGFCQPHYIFSTLIFSVVFIVRESSCHHR